MSALLNLVAGRRSRMVAVLLLIAGVVVLGLVSRAERDASPLDSLPAGFDSTRGQALLDELPDEGSKAALIVFSSDEGPITAYLPQLQETSAAAAAAVGAPVPPLGVPVIPSKDGTAALAALTVDTPTATDAGEVVTQLRRTLKADTPDGVTAQVTGPAAIEADLAAVFEGADLTLLMVTASIVALLLLVTYRSPILWIVPLTVVGVADQVAATAATYVLKAFGVPWDESTLGILSVLVFGAGTNYALLLISRYRDELRSHGDRFAAMRVAWQRAAEAIVASASTVVIGVLCLLLSVVPSTRGLGLACAVGVVIAAVGVLVVLPGVLLLFGRWIFWPVIPREGQPVLAESRSLWRRIGDTVARAPAVWIAVTLVLLAGMAAGLTQVKSGLALNEQFLQTPEAITAAQRLAESFPAGASDPVVVVTRTTDESQVADLAARVATVDGVTEATPTPPQNDIGQVQVVVDADPSSTEAAAVVTAIRAELADTPDTHVTGGAASTLDEDDGSVRDRWVVMPLIFGLVLIALMLLLRSLLAPIILLASVAATYTAALGVSWWLFTGVFGFSAIDASMPLLAFVFLVALGIDYNIFLVTRTMEETRGHGTRAGVLRALGATGGVITSAGILLAAVFAVLGVLPLVVLAQIGVVICIGVLLDTLVVRTILVPAVVRVLGDRFWWPRRSLLPA